MTALGNLERYLKAQIAAHHAPAPAGAERGGAHPFVTISRQAGAGGYRLADELLVVFAQQEDQEVFGGWQIFDQKLCEIVAGDPGFSKSLDSLMSEEYRRPAADMVHSVLRSSLDQDYVMGRVFRVVRALASIGKSIIVGRGGAQVTADMSPGVRMRLVADYDTRIEGVMEHYGLERRQARAHAKKLDASRARLIKTHFDVDIDDPTQYDIVWNTSRSSTEDIAYAVVAMIRHRVAVAGNVPDDD